MDREHGVGEMKEFRMLKTLDIQGIEPNGGGALSSDCVSKLGSKEVSKRLRNFSFAIKKACHCEDERSEDVAIAKSLNINEITTQSSIARNDKYRHAELVSASQTETHSTTYSIHNPSRPSLRKGRRKIAFTLAEVLITLGIIGVVAALTLPSVIQNYKKQVTVNQLKKAYSTLGQVAQKAFADNGPAGFEAGAELKGDDVKAFFDTYWLPYFRGVEVYPINKKPNLNNNKDFYKLVNGDYDSTHVYTTYDAGRIFFSTADGMTYFVYMINWVNNKYDENGNIISQDGVYLSNQLVYVDVNGTKPPNTFGKDVFAFNIDFNNGVVRPKSYNFNQADIDHDCKTYGISCATKIMSEGWKINY